MGSFPCAESGALGAAEIVGEALRAASAIDPLLRERVPALERIVGLRNRLAHAYATISDEVIWGIVLGSVPTLRREIAALVEDPSAP